MAATIFYKTSISIYFPSFSRSWLFALHCLRHFYTLVHSPASKPAHRQATALALIITCSNVCCFPSSMSHWVQSSLSVLLVPSEISAPNPSVALSAALQHTEADAFCLAALQKLVEEGSAVINPFGSQLCCSFSVWGFVLCLSCQSLGFLPLEHCQV